MFVLFYLNIYSPGGSLFGRLRWYVVCVFLFPSSGSCVCMWGLFGWEVRVSRVVASVYSIGIVWLHGLSLVFFIFFRLFVVECVVYGSTTLCVCVLFFFFVLVWFWMRLVMGWICRNGLGRTHLFFLFCVTWMDCCPCLWSDADTCHIVSQWKCHGWLMDCTICLCLFLLFLYATADGTDLSEWFRTYVCIFFRCVSLVWMVVRFCFITQNVCLWMCNGWWKHWWMCLSVVFLSFCFILYATCDVVDMSEWFSLYVFLFSRSVQFGWMVVRVYFMTQIVSSCTIMDNCCTECYFLSFCYLFFWCVCNL